MPLLSRTTAAMATVALTESGFGEGAMPPLGGMPARTAGGSASKSTSSQADQNASSSVGMKGQAPGAGGGGGGASASKATRDPSKLCKCKKSKCVRQYCVCFRAGRFMLPMGTLTEMPCVMRQEMPLTFFILHAGLLCDGCECSECLNDGKHEPERLAAIEVCSGLVCMSA